MRNFGIRTLLGTASALALGAALSAPASAQTFTSTDTPIVIPDSTPAGVTSTINVGFSGTVVDLNTLLNINHTWVGDLVIRLTSPNGTTVNLVNRPGVPPLFFGNGDDLAGAYTFDDGALAPISETTGSGTVAPGSYQTDGTDAQLLADFNGQDAQGTWVLFISDNAGGDLGTVNLWQLLFQLHLNDQYFLAGPIADSIGSQSTLLLGSLAERQAAAFGSAPLASNSDGNAFGADLDPSGSAASSNPYLGGTGGVFLRAGGARFDNEGHIDGAVTANDRASYDGGTVFVQGGVAVPVLETGMGRIVGSLYSHYIQGAYDAQDANGTFRGDFETSGGGLGASLTFQGDTGFFADLALQTTWYGIDIDTDSGDSASTDARSHSLSLEAGQEFAIAPGWSFVPQGQLLVSYLDIDSYIDSAGTRVDFDDNTRVEARGGGGFIYRGEMSTGGQYQANVSAKLAHIFDGSNDFTVAGTDQSYSSDGTDLLLSAGIAISPEASPFRFGLQGSYRTPLDGDDGDTFSGSVSIGYRF